MIWRHGAYWLTDERERIDREAVLALLVRTYWAGDRTRAQLDATIEHSTPYALYHGEQPIGFARALSDRGSCTYLMDIVVHEAHRQNGVGSWMVETILARPEFAQTKFILLTRDAQTFYTRHGFETHPFECMRRPLAQREAG
jgi:N-acetylglutamate synthase-like GNAT family acetyltransferase